MFEVERKRFENVVKAISMDGTIRVVGITLKPTHMYAVNIDDANIAMSYGRFPKHFFVRYNVNDTVSITFDVERVLKILRSMKGDIIKVNKDGDEMQLSTEKEKVSIPLMEQGEFRLPNFVELDENDNLKVKDLHPTVRARIPVLKKELESLGIERTVFVVDEGKLYVEQRSEDGYKFSTKIAEVGDAGSGSYMFDTNYLKRIFNSVIIGEVAILLGKDSPLIVIDKTNDYTLNFFLARLVMGEEIEEVEEEKKEEVEGIDTEVSGEQKEEEGELEDELTKELIEEGAD